MTSTRENGTPKAKRTVRVLKFTLTEASMKATGRMARLMGADG